MITASCLKLPNGRYPTYKDPDSVACPINTHIAAKNLTRSRYREKPSSKGAEVLTSRSRRSIDMDMPVIGRYTLFSAAAVRKHSLSRQAQSDGAFWITRRLTTIQDICNVVSTPENGRNAMHQ